MRICLLAVAMAASGVVFAQTPAPAPAKADPESPQLIKTIVVQPGDSPLVQAAKMAVAARQNAKNRIRINDQTMYGGRGRVSQGTGTMTPALYIPRAPGRPTREEEDPAERARRQELERKVNALRQEQQRMAAEADEPYGGDDEDEERVEQRQTQIPGELNKLQNPTPPSPRQ